MKYSTVAWKKWLTLWDVGLALVFGVVLFFLLNIASAGILASLVTLGVALLLVGAVHYFLWGRIFAGLVSKTSVRGLSRQAETAPRDEFVLGLDDQERLELADALQRSLADTTVDGEKEVLRRQLLDKVRMFGA